ncbi:MAG: zf-HC2 domain-containing protein [Terracidiphilus sp.]
MTSCSGAPAEQYALSYVEGTLPDFEAQRFEEHFFECPVCLAELQALQAVREQLARHPVAIAPVRAKALLGWPRTVWALGAAAAILAVAFAGLRLFTGQAPRQETAHELPRTPVQTQPAQPVPVALAQLADLALPAFAAPRLRGESQDSRFEAGMKAHSAGNCGQAIARLGQVPPASRESLAARFYLGACQRRQGELSTAFATLRSVAAAGDSPQQEAAFYLMAQIALERNDATLARRYLARTVGLRGDFEERARRQQVSLNRIAASGPAAGQADGRSQ